MAGMVAQVAVTAPGRLKQEDEEFKSSLATEQAQGHLWMLNKFGFRLVSMRFFPPKPLKQIRKKLNLKEICLQS